MKMKGHASNLLRTYLNDSVNQITWGHLLKIPPNFSLVLVFSTWNQTVIYPTCPSNFSRRKRPPTMKAVEVNIPTISSQLCHGSRRAMHYLISPKIRTIKISWALWIPIVYALNLLDPFVPICATAPYLTFNSWRKRISVPISNNLYATTRKNSPALCTEGLEGNIKETVLKFPRNAKTYELIPSHWNPYTYFGLQKFQNLWRKKTN